MELAAKMLVNKFVPENPALTGLIEAYERYEKQILDLCGRARFMTGEQQETACSKSANFEGGTESIKSCGVIETSHLRSRRTGPFRPGRDTTDAGERR